jgi:hypothetical protein
MGKGEAPLPLKPVLIDISWHLSPQYFYIAPYFTLQRLDAVDNRHEYCSNNGSSDRKHSTLYCRSHL